MVWGIIRGSTEDNGDHPIILLAWLRGKRFLFGRRKSWSESDVVEAVEEVLLAIGTRISRPQLGAKLEGSWASSNRCCGRPRHIWDSYYPCSGLGLSWRFWGRGNQVQAGLIGTQPSLLYLVDSDLRMSVDFRSVFQEITTNWLGVSGDTAVESSQTPLKLFNV